MNVLFKYLLLQITFMNTCTNVCSIESFYHSSDTSQSALFINGHLDNTTNSVNSTDTSPQNSVNNIYKPHITDYIQNKYKDRIKIIDGEKFVYLTIEEICKCINLHDKYIDTKRKIDDFYYKLNLISQQVLSIESELRLKKDKNNNINNSEFLKEYVTNSLKNTIDYQVNLIKLINSVINKLNDLNKLVTENKIKENIDKYLEIAIELLTDNHDGSKNLYESYIDKFCREIDFSYSNNDKYKSNNEQIFNQYLLKDFRIAHDNFIKSLNNNIININNKISNIVSDTIYEMKQNNDFIFTIDKYNCRKNHLINEINILISDFKSYYDIMTNWVVNIQLSMDVKSCSKILLDKLESYKKRLSTNPLLKLQHILQKNIIFNCDNKENVERFQNKINEIKGLVINIK